MDSGELTVYRGCTPVVDAKFDKNVNHSPTEVIADALASAAGVDPVELPPLYDYVDPDAIDTLFDRPDEAVNTNAILGFQVESWNVFVRSDGQIRICDGTKSTEPQPVFQSSSD